MTGFTFFLNIHFDGRLEHSVKGDKKGSTKKQLGEYCKSSDKKYWWLGLR